MRLTIQNNEMMGDWFTIERLEHDERQWLESTGPNSMALRCSSRISDADVEGTREEMLAIATAIERRGSEDFRRCAVDVQGDRVEFWSPRNSQRPGVVTLAEADELAKVIREKLGPTLQSTEGEPEKHGGESDG